ncbi:MAG: PTS sugar transporter subunit IIA [Peptostreptococcaceae bacterium]
MIKLLLASHGDLADGIYSTLKIIMGSQDKISTLCAYKDEDFDLHKEVSNIMDNLSSEDKLIVITDIYGGSINNEFMNYLDIENFYLISGLNLPLLMELLLIDDECNIEVKIQDALENSKQSIQYCNPIIKSIVLEDDTF